MKRKFRKRTFKRKKRGGKKFKVKVTKVVRSLQKHKWYETFFGPFGIGSAVANQLLTPIPVPLVGGNRNARVGNQYIIKSLHYRGAVTQNAITPLVPIITRIIIFVERVPGTDTLTAAQLSSGPNNAITPQKALFSTSDTTGQSSWLSFMNPDTVPSRYRILRDFIVKQSVTNAVAASSTVQVNYWQKKIIFKGGLTVTTNDNSTTSPPEINKNCVWLLAVCDNPLATGSQMDYSVMLKYADI